ncbi:hypothetical protein BACCAP_01429 [Pseudoflavonifractor capillosus ATCC 29799]|uniref:Uncharacterized protein n=1 Tax=Pseudoflavonifractor capillosus ATCC 29799 TaxID=411467 RepID=A6NTA0_9FIRM|nr:hypothetical protein BACCAP_01429 [Pseudoflavonifractor capillosus ATCC 29799]
MVGFYITKSVHSSGMDAVLLCPGAAGREFHVHSARARSTPLQPCFIKFCILYTEKVLRWLYSTITLLVFQGDFSE